MRTVRGHIYLLTLFVGLLAFILVFFQYRAQNQMMHRYADQVMTERAELVQSLLSINDRFYKTLTHDYSYWDEMITFIDKPDYAWAKDNIRNIIDAYRGNAVWIYNLSGRMIYSVANPDREDILNADLLGSGIQDPGSSIIVTASEAKQQHPASSIQHQLLEKKMVHFYLRTSAGVMDVNGATVHPTNDPERLTPPRGFFFIGKLLDSAFIRQLETNTRCQAAILYLAPPESGQEETKTIVIPLQNTGQTEPAAYIRLTRQTSDILRFSTLSNTYLTIYIIAIVVTAFVVIILLLSWVIFPLGRISRQLEKEGIQIDQSGRERNEYRRISGMIEEFSRQKEQIRQSEERFRKLSASTTAAIIIHDDKHIHFANQAAEQMLGYSQEELKETDFLKIIHPDFLEGYRRIPEEGAEEPGRIWRSESRFVTKEGEEIYVDVTTVVINLDPGPVFLVTAHDITDRIRMERELVVAKERAEESDKLKSSFLTNLSHEIRTPMNSILGFSNLLRKENVSKKELGEYAEIIIFSTNRLLRLIEDILEIARIETDQVVLNETPFSVDLLLDEMKDYLEGEQEGVLKKEITVEVFRAPGKSALTLVADMERFRDVLHNLLDNALKFTEKGKIRFGYKLIGETVKFSVEDTGIGIPKEHRATVFNRFFQVDAANNRLYQGSGLGLTIARAYVELMG
ncbi:MAG: PAS domain S-box protein, partial [Bacteroidetes bacterium]